jgi:hypothetical protein
VQRRRGRAGRIRVDHRLQRVLLNL